MRSGGEEIKIGTTSSPMLNNTIKEGKYL